MNKYKLLSICLKVISAIALIVMFTYYCYILATPGYYWYLVLNCVVTLICIVLYYKFRVGLKERMSAKFPSKEDLIEHRYGMTYRKRFYNVWYLILLVLFYVGTISLLSVMVYRQCDSELNARYKESLEYVTNFGFDKPMDCSIFYKAAPITPNSTKEGIIHCADILKYINQLAVQLNEWKEAQDVEGVVLAGYKAQFEEFMDIADSKKSTVVNDVYLLLILVIILKLSSSELKSYAKHRSITL